MLYAAKYLWYADMFAVKLLGRSMTGATYARLPFGPQLNNYRDLLEDIQNADPEQAEPLSMEELDIIRRISQTFPEDRMVYDAAHKEPAWLETSNGDFISYSWADQIDARLQ
nr:SocA family protein [Desulfobacula sp.]